MDKQDPFELTFWTSLFSFQLFTPLILVDAMDRSNEETGIASNDNADTNESLMSDRGMSSIEAHRR
jgi:hypothetical protein